MATSPDYPKIDEEHKNWLTTALSLNIVRDVLGPQIKQEIDQFHSQLKNNNLPMCGRCVMKNVKFDKKNRIWEINCLHCQPWLLQVSAQHSSKAEQNVYKQNSDLTKWEKDSWEIAKFFMPKGQRAVNTGPEKSDCAALISMMTNCKLLTAKFGSSTIKRFQELSTLRNQTYHSTDMRLPKQKMQDTIDKMIDVLTKVFKGSEQQAVDQLEKMRDNPLNLPGEEFLAAEIEVINGRLSELITTVEERANNQDGGRDSETETALMQTMNFIVSAGDSLREELQPKIDEGLTIMAHIQTNMKAMDQRVGDSEQRITQVEDQIIDLCALKAKFEELKKAAQTAKVTVDHKGQLQTYTQTKSKSKVRPEYEFFPHENGGYVAQVTVEGKVFEITEPHAIKIDAEKAAAKEALIGLGQLRRAGPSSTSKGASGGNGPGPLSTMGVSGGTNTSPAATAGVSGGARPKEPPQPNLEPTSARRSSMKSSSSASTKPSGLFSPHPDLISRTEKVGNVPVSFTAECPNECKNQWQASGEFQSVGVIQLPSSEEKPNKKETKQAAACMLLAKIGIALPKGSVASNYLHAHCGQKKITQPEYVTDEEKNVDGNFGCIVIWEELIKENVIALRGEMCNSAENAINSAKDGIKNLIAKLPKEIPKSSAARIDDNAINSSKPSESLKPDKKTMKHETETSAEAASGGATNKNEHQVTKTVPPAASSKPAEQKAGTSEKSPARRNYVGELKEYFDKCKDFEKVGEDFCQVDGKFRQILNLKANDFREIPQKTYSTNKEQKEADKTLALYVLSKLYPSESATVDNAKNVLQEISVKEMKCIPIYSDREKTGIRVRSCELTFQVSSELYSDKTKAKQDACKRALEIVKPQ